MLGDSDALPFRRLESAGLLTPNLLAASVTDIPAGMTRCRMSRPMCMLGSDGLSKESSVLCSVSIIKYLIHA